MMCGTVTPLLGGGSVSPCLVDNLGYRIEYSFYIFSCNLGNEVKKGAFSLEKQGSLNRW